MKKKKIIMNKINFLNNNFLLIIYYIYDFINII